MPCKFPRVPDPGLKPDIFTLGGFGFSLRVSNFFQKVYNFSLKNSANRNRQPTPTIFSIINLLFLLLCLCVLQKSFFAYVFRYGKIYSKAKTIPRQHQHYFTILVYKT